jgi:dTDP-4-dehydrorhamnose reductase
MLLITGAGGFLGANALLEARDAGHDVVGTYHSTPIRGPGVRAVMADLSLPGAFERLLDSLRPDWVLNCIAYANVDGCERDPDRAAQINTALPRSLAIACRDRQVRLLQVSTDSVFDGKRGGYTETDSPGPVNFYAKTKLDGERAVIKELPDALVVRTNFVGHSSGSRVGLVDWIIRELTAGRRISGFTDVVFSPLVANDLVRTMLSMMDARLSGLYNAGAAGATSKFDFAVSLARELGLDPTLVHPARLADAPLDARRPLNTSLSSAHLEKKLGRAMPTIDEGVALLGKLRASDYPERLNAQLGN